MSRWSVLEEAIEPEMIGDRGYGGEYYEYAMSPGTDYVRTYLESAGYVITTKYVWVTKSEHEDIGLVIDDENIQEYMEKQAEMMQEYGAGIVAWKADEETWVVDPKGRPVDSETYLVAYRREIIGG